MSDFELKFTLKQHTPMIHFQSDQLYATLRVSELKPKLDDFIKNNLVNIDKKLYQYYRDVIENKDIFPNDKGSNKYKLNIHTTSKNIENNTGAFFGNSDNRQYEAITSSIAISISIKSLNKRLNKLLKQSIRYVLVLNNFGTRQNKGYGSFTPTDMERSEFENILLKKYHQTYTKNSNSPLQTIKNDYQLLKSGRNVPNAPYKKSILFDYMCIKSNIKWEKRMIKEYMKKDYLNIFNLLKYETDNHRIKRCNNENDQYTYKYIRGLLGIGEQIEFLKQNGGNNNKVTIKIIPENNKIKRFASPILFKVFENKIYVVGEDGISIEGEKFSFQLNGNVLNEPIEIPRGFILSDFLDYAFNLESNYQKNLGYQKSISEEQS